MRNSYRWQGLKFSRRSKRGRGCEFNGDRAPVHLGGTDIAPPLRRDPFNLRNKPVATTRKSFDITRLTRRIAQGLAKLIHRGIQTVVEVYEGIRWPQSTSQFLPSHQLSRLLEQNAQDLEGLSHKF